MQKVKPNLFLQLIVIPVFLVLDFILGRYYPEAVLQAYPLTWIFLILLTFFCLTPIARKPLTVLPNEKPRLKPLQWLATIWIFELCVLALFSGLLEIAHLLQPELTSNPSVLNSVWLGDWEILPWGITLSLACLTAYYAYLKNKDASFSTLLFPLFRSAPNQVLGIIANVCARLNMALALVVSLMMTSLALAILVGHFTHITLLGGLNLESILCLTAILILMGHGKLGAGLFKTLLNRQSPVFMVLSIVMILLAVLLVVMSWMLKGVDLHPVTLPEWLVQNAPIFGIYKLFLVAWTLAWCFIGGVFIAYISRGYKMLELVSAGLSLPALIFLIQHFFSFRIIWVSPIPVLFLSVLACFTLFYVFTKTRAYLSMLMQVYVAADDEVKIRPYTSFVINWIRMAVGLLYLYLPGGILILALMSIMLTLPTIFYLLVGALAGGVALLLKAKNS